jgi:hypothetical protein
MKGNIKVPRVRHRPSGARRARRYQLGPEIRDRLARLFRCSIGKPTLDGCAASLLVLASRVTVLGEEAERDINLGSSFVTAEEVADLGPRQSRRHSPQRLNYGIGNIVTRRSSNTQCAEHLQYF